MKSTQSLASELIGERQAELRIRAALKAKSDYLDLANLELTQVPMSLGKLFWLRTLNLSGNHLYSVSDDLTRLKVLQTLYLASNRLSDFPILLVELNQLQLLELSGNDLNHIPEWIRDFKQLKVLHLSDNNIKVVPDSICELNRLEALYLSSNQIGSLPEGLNKIENLQTLHLSNNNLIGLPKSMQQMRSLKDLRLSGNTALALPSELSDTETTSSVTGAKSILPASILAYYFKACENRRHLDEAKLIFVGRGGVGKTSLAARLTKNTFNPFEVETPGIAIQHWQIQVSDGSTVRVHLWDFGGQEILHGTHQLFLTARTVYLLVLSGRESNAMQDAEYWLQLISSFGGNSRVIIALNKVEQHPFDINRQLLCEKYQFLVDFVETDCSGNGVGMDKLRDIIVSTIDTMENRKILFPADWFTIKEQLSTLRENYITWEQYQAICNRCGEGNLDFQRLLADFLHNLGVVLHYGDDPRLRDTRILNPTWVTEGIYNFIRVGQRANAGGVLNFEVLLDALDAEQYPASKCDFLLSLMERFQLCFRLPTSTAAYLIPELLGENQPDIRSLLNKPGLDFRYQYEMLPQGLLPRFIVQTRMYSEENPAWRWRTGVILEKDGCGAIVRADERERRIDIHITGSTDLRRRELLAVIREKFEEQHQDLKGLFVDERVPIPGQRGSTVSYRHLTQLEEEGILEFRPEGLRKHISISELLGGVGETTNSNSQKAKGIYLLRQLDSTIKSLKRGMESEG